MTTPHPNDPGQPPQNAGPAGPQPEHTVRLARSQVTAEASAPPQPQQQPPQQPPAQPPQQPQPAGAAPGGYSSPIPLVRTHIGHAIASEWVKIRSVRSTVWTLSVMFVLVVGIGFLTATGLSGGDSRYIDVPVLAPGLYGLMLGQIAVITLGVLVITSEYGTGMIRTTLTASPQRGRVLLAKALVYFLLAFVMTTVACALTALISSSMLGGQEVGPDTVVSDLVADSIQNGKLVATGEEWLSATVGAGLYVALLGLLSLAVGALLRHSAGAITTMLGVILLPMLLAAFMQSPSLNEVQEALMEYSPLNGLATLFGIPMQGSPDASGWPLLGVLAAVTAGALLAAYGTLTKRDV